MLEAAKSGVLDGLALEIEGVDLHHPAKTVRLVWMAGRIEALIMLMPAVASPRLGNAVAALPLEETAFLVAICHTCNVA